MVRLYFALGLLLLCGCRPTLIYHSQSAFTAEALDRVNLVFVGVIEQHRFEPWPYFRLVMPPEARRGKTIGEPMPTALGGADVRTESCW